MSRVVPVLLILVAFWIPAAAQEKKPAPAGQPVVSWYGQSFFTIKSSKGTLLAIDPHQIPYFGRPDGLKPDVVLFSHLHNDHTNIAAFDNAEDKKLRIISGLTGTGKNTKHANIDAVEKDFQIRSVPAYHDAAEGMTRGKNTIFVIDVDGWKFCHLGDLGHELTPAHLKKIGEVDVLMVPVGGIYTLNGSEAKKAVAMIQPKEYIFPMHYGNKVYDDLLPIDEFLDEQEKNKVAVSEDNKVTLNKDGQRPRPLIVQLGFAPKAAVTPPKKK